MANKLIKNTGKIEGKLEPIAQSSAQGRHLITDQVELWKIECNFQIQFSKHWFATPSIFA